MEIPSSMAAVYAYEKLYNCESKTLTSPNTNSSYGMPKVEKAESPCSQRERSNPYNII